MGSIGMPEMVMIFVVILLCFGPKKLPELARGIGKAMGEFKRAREEFEHEITHAIKHAGTGVTAKEPEVREPVAAETVCASPVDHGLR